jgi:tellurite resistance protein
VAGDRAWQDVLTAAITLLIGGIAVRTLVALRRRQLLPTPPLVSAAPAAAQPEAPPAAPAAAAVP